MEMLKTGLKNFLWYFFLIQKEKFIDLLQVKILLLF